jgi:general stress protein YciG
LGEVKIEEENKGKMNGNRERRRESWRKGGKASGRID